MLKKHLPDMVNAYFELQEAIYKYFGYKEDWVVIPLENHLNDYWLLTGEGPGHCMWCRSPITPELIEAGNEIYSGPIYTQRFLPKWVYRTELFTMISVNTQTDGNRFLMIFDNSKECTDKDLINIYEENWGHV